MDQAADHFGDDFEPLLESESRGVFDGPAPAGDFQTRNTLLSRAAGDCEEVVAIGLCEASVSLGQFGSDREGGAIQLVDEKAIAARETFGQGSDLVREINGLLVDFHLLEREGRDASRRREREQRPCGSYARPPSCLTKDDE